MTALIERTEKALSSQKLSDRQKEAASERDRNVVVTAGAGSGKTRTLVARYISLLADGLQPEKVVGITFTEKAANEMRSRVRSAIRDQVVQSEQQKEQRFWMGLEQQIDAARIGTIHSLCAEILRNHPAQAGIDPLFGVVDEGEATILLAEAVETALVAITQEKQFVPLFELLKVSSLESILTQMMKKRLELQTWLAGEFSFDQFVKTALEPFMTQDEMGSCVQELKSFSPQALESDTTPKGVEQVQNFLSAWKQIEAAWGTGDYLNCLQTMILIRYQILNRLDGGKNSDSKMHLTSWRAVYDEILGWVGKDFNPELEEKIAGAMPLLKDAFTFTLDLYNQYLSNRRALDFDDLEERALSLLKRSEIAQKWQEKVQALLVDEFQDTNQRQRQLIEALTAGNPGRLFVVGDSRQSIYRFRGADVTVFRDVRLKTEHEGGLVCELSESYRTHPGLMRATDAILGPIMGVQDDPGKPFHVPFTKMIAMRDEIPSGLLRPYLEVLIGAGSDSDDGRMLAANLLAHQLIAYKQAGEIQNWKDVALLFRASGAFPVYEQAFEAAGIPYVTIAGSGFYDRPEIRDILNLLRTLADPWDDLAMVGFLRSPAVGMSDRGITQLRWSQTESEPLPFRQALEQDTSYLTIGDQQAAAFALTIFSEFEALTGTIPVAALLQRLIERTHYRVILAGTVDRGWRNIEKLLMDAYDSHQTSVHAYLEYVQKIRATGVREGEAAGAAEDALQLMTIHKSKGLEFPWVILADAGRRANVRKDRWLVVDDWLAIHSDREDYSSLLSRYLKKQDADKEEAENRRLLYVALTRAKDKLMVSGHFSQTKEKYTVNGWLKEILNLLDLEPNLLVEIPPAEPLQLPGEELLGIQLWKEMVEFPATLIDERQEQSISMRNFLSDLQTDVAIHAEKKEEQINLDLFETSDRFPLWVGKLLHQAIQRWEFRNAEALQQFLERSAIQLGILDESQQRYAILRAKLFMQRLQEHPIYEEINQASRRYHEIPYELKDESQNERGRLDVLYQTERGWKIVDFKTDQLATLTDLDEERKVEYRTQLLRYQNSVFQQLKEIPVAQFCFLNCGNTIQLVNLEDF